MTLSTLLDTSRLTVLRQRLQARLTNAPEHGLISITLDLGARREDWLNADMRRPDTFYWSHPGNSGHGNERLSDHRLALGRALFFSTAGMARFTALQAAFKGLLPYWQHDDSDHSGIEAAAHLGFAFEDNVQNELPNALLCVPAILLQNRAQRCTATFSCTVRDAATAVARWCETLRSASRRRPPGWPPDVPVRKASPLGDRAFLARAHAALDDIASGKIDKVVLTRKVAFQAAQAIAVAPLLAALADRHAECTTYSVAQASSVFIGATPERLVSLNNGIVRADALAGTAWLSATSDAAQECSLKLHGDKNSREQQMVVDAVRSALAPLCISLDPPQTPEIMQLRKLQHLRTRVSGRLRDGVGLFDLIARLHPTPAVGGTPTAAARQWLQAHGEQRAAWYTGGLGWIDRRGNGEIAVPLRCANIKGAHAELFAGAGVVAGSDPYQELAETEVKLGAMIDALQHAGPRNDRSTGEIAQTGTH